MRVKSLEELGLSLYAIREDGCLFHTENLNWVKPNINERGYCRVTLFKDDGSVKKFSIHRLVAWAFVNGYEESLIVNHLDSNPMNNHFSNLEWTTHSGNSKHMVASGRFKAPNKKLTDTEISFITTSGIKTKQLSEMFSVSKACIKYHKSRGVFVKEVQ